MQYKSQNADEPAVTDDTTGKAYVEQFGLETFERADKAVLANKASRQTADTFQAAATFLDLLAIWGALEQEMTAKIKYAKYHALRIAKAIKAGEDPNDSNPQPTHHADEGLPDLDPNDAEVQALERGGRPRQPSVVEIPDEADKIQKSLANTSAFDESLHPSRETSTAPKPRQPSVAEVPDETDKLQARLAKTSSLDESLHPSRAPSAPPQETVSPIDQDPTTFYNDADKAPVSPLDQMERKQSLGGNYFPAVPAAMSQPPLSAPFDPNHSLPAAPSNITQPQIPPPAPAHRHGRSLDAGSSPTTARQNHGPLPPPPPQTQHIPPPIAGPPPVAPLSPPIVPPSQAAPAPAQSFAPTPSGPAAWNVPQQVNEEAMLSAQKHCRWAISALNFEDVPTAVKELRGALQDLGGL